jgi:cytochrome oxidase Cu insertion factor (SCO1/SenC/PrrC family)
MLRVGAVLHPPLFFWGTFLILPRFFSQDKGGNVAMVRFVRILFIFALLYGVWPKPAFSLGPLDGQELPPTDLERVAVGSSAPEFLLEDEKGNSIALSQFREKKNVVLVFYRGHW